MYLLVIIPAEPLEPDAALESPRGLVVAFEFNRISVVNC